MTPPVRVFDWLIEDPALRRAWDEDALPRAIGDALTGMRRGAGLSQAELARAAGWDPSYVSRLERGGSAVPAPETVARFAAACGLVASYAFHDAAGATLAEIPLVALAGKVRRPLRRRPARGIGQRSAGERAPERPTRQRLPLVQS